MDELARRSRPIRMSSPLADVTASISDATSRADLTVWIGCRNGEYRWSPATRGGPYPLQRLLARYLNLDHERLMLTAIEVAPGWSIVQGDGPADAEAIVTVPAGSTADVVEQLLLEALV